MNQNLIAKASTTIEASSAEVWNALVTPAAIKQYMFGTDVTSDWQEGSPITWKGEMKGTRYEDHGVILAVDPEKTLRYSHFSPLSGTPDTPENRHIVTIVLSDAGDKTEVSLTQDNNRDETAREESTKNWDIMLQGLKQYVEGSS